MTFKVPDDAELLAIVDGAVRDASGYLDSKLTKERQLALEYYQGKRPFPQHNGDSKYVSMDVYDAVESMKANLLETFAAGADIIQFSPQGAEDVEPARIASEYVSYIIHRQNDGYGIFQDTIHDALMARSGIIKYWWEETLIESEEEVKDASEDDFDMLLQDEDVEVKDFDVDELTGLISGTILRSETKAQVRITVVPPEEFLISRQSESIEAAFCVAHRTQKTVSDLIEMGVSEKVAKRLGEFDDTGDDFIDAEKIARNDDIGSMSTGLGDRAQDQSKLVWVYEVFMHLDLDGEGKTKLWKITKAGSEILDKEQVGYKPFIDYTPLPQPHVFYGGNYAAKVQPTQNARTILTRSIINHALITNNPRYQVVKGGLLNPKELMENRIGGIVNVSRPDAVQPLLQANLNPHVFQTIQLLDEDKEETTGISRLSQGLSKDAVSKQNSQGMVNDLINISQVRQRIVARNFAYGFLQKLYIAVYQLAIEKADKEQIFEVSGNWVPVNPKDWRSRKDVQVDFHLSNDAKKEQATLYAEVDLRLSQDAALAPMYTPTKRYNVISRSLRAFGIKDIDNILENPEKVQPPGPSMEEQLQQKEMAIRERQQALAEQKQKWAEEQGRFQMLIDKKRIEIEASIKSDDLDLKERGQSFDEYVAEEELKLARAAPEITAIASPNS